MKVISAKHWNGNPVSPEQFREDLPELRRIHNNALKTETTWEFFGGTIDIEDRTYQVC